jgi:hypothetical protein
VVIAVRPPKAVIALAAFEGVVAGVYHERAVWVEVAAEEKVVAAFAIEVVVASATDHAVVAAAAEYDVAAAIPTGKVAEGAADERVGARPAEDGFRVHVVDPDREGFVEGYPQAVGDADHDGTAPRPGPPPLFPASKKTPPKRSRPGWL